MYLAEEYEVYLYKGTGDLLNDITGEVTSYLQFKTYFITVWKIHYKKERTTKRL